MGQSKHLASELRKRGFDIYKVGGVNIVRGLKDKQAKSAAEGRAGGGSRGEDGSRGELSTEKKRKRAYNMQFYEANKKERLFKCAVGSVLSGMKPIRKTRALYGWSTREVNLIRTHDPEYRLELEARMGASLSLQYVDKKPLPPLPSMSDDGGESGSEGVGDSGDSALAGASLEDAVSEPGSAAPEDDSVPVAAGGTLRQQIDDFVVRHMDIFRRFANKTGGPEAIPKGGKHVEARAFLLRKLHCERMSRTDSHRVSLAVLEGELADAVNRNKTLAGRADTRDIPPAFPEFSRAFRGD
jgi:hypothetical protein